MYHGNGPVVHGGGTAIAFRIQKPQSSPPMLRTAGNHDE